MLLRGLRRDPLLPHFLPQSMWEAEHSRLMHLPDSVRIDALVKFKLHWSLQ